MPTHPLTTIVTRSNNLCFDGAFRSHRRSHRHCASLSQAHRCCFSLSISLLLPLPPPQPSIFSLKSLSLSLSLYHDLVLGLCHKDFCFVFFFVSLGLYIGIFIIIFVWKFRKLWEMVENVFSRAFSRTQTNTWKYFRKDFLECNQTPKNIFLFQKCFQLKLFYTLKIFYIDPNIALVF